jgi:ATP-dependent Lhr-like helicase
LDVLTHQIVGLTLFEEDGIPVNDAYNLIVRAYPFNGVSWEEFNELTGFLSQIGLIIKLGEDMKKTGKGRKYYFENLGMINDERRYPFINAITDEIIGTVGDEFWSLRARLGLNVILRGRVWRILQIDEERGVLHALPSTDPLGALPGWDGELIPVPTEVAQDVGDLRERIANDVLKSDNPDTIIKTLADELQVDVASIRVSAQEAEAHVKTGLPLPTRRHILLEVYDKYLVIHSSYGENVNRTLSAVLDIVLSENELIYGWWCDPYRILIEAPMKINQYEVKKVEEFIKGLTPDDADKHLYEFIEARFPFGYRMKFIAERFGVIPRGKIMGPDRLELLYRRYKNTPIYKETLREAYQEKLDLPELRKIITGISNGTIELTTLIVNEPSILARHILEKYADVEELMATDSTIEDQLEYMKQSIRSRSVNLACVNCGEWTSKSRIREIEDKPHCQNCGSGLLAMMRRHQDPEHFLAQLNRWKNGEELLGDEKEVLVRGRKTADMILSYGRKAVEALMVYGVGPVTSYQVLSKMHRDEKDFYQDLLKAKIQYMKTRQYWDDK